MDKALAYAENKKTKFLRELQEYLQIPSISTLPEHADNIQHAAEYAANDLKAIGLNNVRLISHDDGNPFVFGEWLGKPGAPTILIYGHYDTQPVDPLSGWDRDPFSADISEGIIWARGASDNKGQHFAHMKAVEAYLNTSGELPVNVKILLEGEEEVGSPNIDGFISAHQRLLTADTGIISDGAMAGPGLPKLNYGLRGVAALEIRVQGPGRDLHSGSYGGTVLNPIQALTEILSALHDSSGKVTVPGFYDDVRILSDDERVLLKKANYTLEKWQEDTGACAPWGEEVFTLLERIGARPTLEINGIWGGFQDEGVKTVIPATAGTKITMRLVPNQSPDKILRLVSEHIKSISPSQVKLEIFNFGGSWPSLTPSNSKELIAASEILEFVWGKPPVVTLGGGSLPVVAAFYRKLSVPFVLMPFGLDDNRHSTNEHMILDNFYKGIETAIRYYKTISELN